MGKYTMQRMHMVLLLAAAALRLLLLEQVALPTAAAAVDRIKCDSNHLYRPEDGLMLTTTDPDTGAIYRVAYLGDCNLCATATPDGGPPPYWCWTYTPPRPCLGLYFSCDGNLQILYKDGGIAWQTNTAQGGSGPAQPWEFRLGTNGNFFIYNSADSTPLWSRSYTSSPQTPG